MCWCEQKRKMDEAQTKLYQEWQKKWSSERGKGKSMQNDMFLSLYHTTYNYTKAKVKVNKGMNFLIKGAFVIVLLFGLTITLKHVVQSQTVFTVVRDTISFALVIWACGIVSKWNDIKKYQETWVRHSVHLYRMNQEMIKYVEVMAPYKEGISEYNEKLFVKKILEIWAGNQEKFVDNMEKGEKELMDIFSYFPQIQKSTEN